MGREAQQHHFHLFQYVIFYSSLIGHVGLNLKNPTNNELAKLPRFLQLFDHEIQIRKRTQME
jgi:hypothetical protein